jgi:hypothetical protein
VERLYQAFRGRAEFVLVKIREPNSCSIPELESVRDVPGLSPEERRQTARQAMRILRLTVLVVLDERDARVEQAYDAFPMRLVIVGVDGRIALDAGYGAPAGQWDFAAIDAWLTSHTQS